MLKRVFDIVFSIFILLLISPVFILIILLMKVTSVGPVFYCPIRVGKNMDTFKMMKIRTLRYNDVKGKEKAINRNDVRFTLIGSFLRRWSLDEIPQFFNVIKGNMSVVGPRPHRESLDKIFREEVPMYQERYAVLPGITGWAQVNGWRGPTSEIFQKEQRTTHDLWYIENWSLWLDIKIILLTIISKKTRYNAF